MISSGAAIKKRYWLMLKLSDGIKCPTRIVKQRIIIAMNILEVNHLPLVVVLILSSTILIKSGKNLL